MRVATNNGDADDHSMRSDAVVGIALWIIPELIILILAGCLLMACHVL